MHDSIHLSPFADDTVPPYTSTENTPGSDPKGPTPSQNSTSQQMFVAVLPLDELQEGPAPADCPACGVRSLTKKEYLVGDKAKYIRL